MRLFPSRVRTLQERAERQHRRIADLEREVGRLSPQVAALEERLEDLRQRLELSLDDVSQASPEEEVEALTLVEDVRREHARVRARISAATVFEERLRVLESHAGLDHATGRPTLA